MLAVENERSYSRYYSTTITRKEGDYQFYQVDQEVGNPQKAILDGEIDLNRLPELPVPFM